MTTKTVNQAAHKYAIGEVVYYLVNSLVGAMRITQVDISIFDDAPNEINYTGVNIISAGNEYEGDNTSYYEHSLFQDKRQLTKIMGDRFKRTVNLVNEEELRLLEAAEHAINVP